MHGGWGDDIWLEVVLPNQKLVLINLGFMLFKIAYVIYVDSEVWNWNCYTEAAGISGLKAMHALLIMCTQRAPPRPPLIGATSPISSPARSAKDKTTDNLNTSQ